MRLPSRRTHNFDQNFSTSIKTSKKWLQKYDVQSGTVNGFKQIIMSQTLCHWLSLSYKRGKIQLIFNKSKSFSDKNMNFILIIIIIFAFLGPTSADNIGWNRLGNNVNQLRQKYKNAHLYNTQMLRHLSKYDQRTYQQFLKFLRSQHQ